ncbi:MAG: 4Fe-4S dicluster domain-containing protein [Coriobacteriales bacterium]|jgi:anaerobic dimethyl sulfoxide reductase subunit B (iron-sulfur subunit)|nr:4Fe-4S dicluster domain-containing protein [Coriobacteriales bacterium]
MAQYGFFFDQSRCYGCQACSVACKDWNDLEPGPKKWMSVYDWETGTLPDVRINILAFNCGHCDDPACAKACPSGAIFKEDKYGAVLVDEDKCTGARKCLDACPYGSPKFANDNPSAKMSKCTMCIDRLEKGEKPVCVLSCPMRAFDFGPIDELRQKYGDCAQLAEMPDPKLTHPNVVYKAHRDRQQFVPLDGKKVLELQKDRNVGQYKDAGLDPVYTDLKAETDPPAGEIKRNKLVMVNKTAEAVMAATSNDLG